MNYPSEILPDINYKLICCDLSGYFLIRHTSTSNLEEIWDYEVNEIKQQAICSPSEHIVDLSTSLLGIYNFTHLPIELTQLGKHEYGEYCEPDYPADTPIYMTHFTLNENRGFWIVLIENIQNSIADYTFGDIEGNFQAICKVLHTPAKWNFWHFSIKWFLPEKGLYLDDIPDNGLKKKITKRLKGEARALIAKYAKIDRPNYWELSDKCYKK